MNKKPNLHIKYKQPILNQTEVHTNPVNVKRQTLAAYGTSSGKFAKLIALGYKLPHALQLLISFVLLVLDMAIYEFTKKMIRSKPLIRILPGSILNFINNLITNVHKLTMRLFDRNGMQTISRVDLIQLSLKTMQVKRTRSIVTMGGMALGIALIVFLVSLGYGLQDVVVSRVVRLNEMRQADVAPGSTEELALTDATVVKFSGLNDIVAVYPIISIVGNINYQNSSTDIAVYGVTKSYLEESAIAPVEGRIFENDSIAYDGSLEQRLQKLAVTEADEDQNPFKVISQPEGLVKSGSLDLIELDIEEEAVDEGIVLALEGDPAREIVVNEGTLELIGLTRDNAVGEKIEIELILLGETLKDFQDTVQSVPTTYTIVGITPENTTPIAYIPLVDVRSLGADHFSQIKVVASSPDHLAAVRTNIESLGFITSSVADTVEQIDNLFGTLRLLLSILGLVALGVAALGMFNTLTVSLLERTHEVGLLKALGMNSAEVRELFLTESMIMGFFGGILGLLLGVIAGKSLGLLLTLISISRGGESIAVAQTPLSFAMLIITLSLLIGIFTGYYPAFRTTKISALDALRYE